MNPAPSLAARPPAGTRVTISSTRRDKDAEGEVISHDEVGLRVLCGGEVGEVTTVRFYPWGQIAFVQWAPVQPGVEEDALEDLDGVVSLETLNVPLARFAVVESMATMTPQDVRRRLQAWKGVPTTEAISDRFAQALEGEGFPVVSFVAREAETRDIIPGETSWGDDNAGSPMASLNDDRQPGGQFLQPVGRMTLRPEMIGYRLPPVIEALSPDVALAVWAAVTHTPAELQTIFDLHEGDFNAYMRRLADETTGAHEEAADGEDQWSIP